MTPHGEDKMSQTKTQTTKAPANTKDSGRVQIGGSALNF
jgi:hypothetical protein